jgi:hypothetical protein
MFSTISIVEPTLGGLTAEGWTAVLTLVLVVIAAATAYSASRTWKAEHRAYVVVDFEPEGRFVSLVVKNIGRTPARDVRFQFKPGLRSTWDNAKDSIGGLPMVTAISYLPPGREHRTFFDYADRRRDAGLPTAYEVRASFLSPATHGQEVQWDVFMLDLQLATARYWIETRKNS